MGNFTQRVYFGNYHHRPYRSRGLDLTHMKNIQEKQFNIIWYINDLKISHIESRWRYTNCHCIFMQKGKGTSN